MRRAAILCLAFAATSAHAWDAATTHAGLTENAVLASHLGRFLVDTLHRPLGLYEPLTLEGATARVRSLRSALDRLDAAAGYQPAAGKLPALEWVVAGSVLEETPAGRVRNHFYDPATGKGLEQGGYLSGLDLRLDGVRDGVDGIGDLLSGGGFDGTGVSSIAWMNAPGNALSLDKWLDARERASSALTARERDAALAEALLVAGALVHLVEDAGEPALVHGDFRVDLAREGGPLRRWVAERHGRLDVPAPSGGAEHLAHLADAIHRADGEGLADRTARRFPSLGTVGVRPATQSGKGAWGYATSADARHLARWKRDSGGVIAWDLDERCLADAAAVLLPETARAALSALEHLLRGGLVLDAGVVKVGALSLGPGRVTVFDDDAGKRRPVVTRDVSGGAPGDTLSDLPTTLTGKTVVVYRGRDAEGEPLVLSVE